VVSWLLRLRIVSVVVATVIFFVTYPVSIGLQFDRTITAMFAPHEQTFKDYMLLREYFGSNTVIMFVYHDPQLMTNEGIERNAEIARRVAQIDGVIGALSTSLLDNSVRNLVPGLDPDQPAILQGDEKSLQRRFEKLFAGFAHSDDRDHASIVTILSLDADEKANAELQQLADELPHTILKGIAEKEVAIVGEPVLIQHGFEMIDQDGFRLAALTIILLSFVVAISLGSMRFVILTAVLIGWSVVVTRAVMVWGGVNLSIMSSILTAIITVIAVATILHIGVRFRGLLARGHGAYRGAELSLSRLLLPVTVACLTDAAGFIALQSSSILPVRDFGFSISVGALAVLVGVMLWAPAIMTFSDMVSGRHWRLLQAFRRIERSLALVLRRASRRLGMAAIDHRGICVAISLVSLGLTYYGFENAKSETSFLNNFRADNKIVINYGEVEEHFGGVGVWDIVIEAPVVITQEYLTQISELEASLKEIDADGARLTKLLSLAAVDGNFTQGSLARLIPPAQRLSAMSQAMPGVLDTFLSQPRDGRRYYRIMLRSKEQYESAARNSLIQQVKQTVEQKIASEEWQRAMGRPSDPSDPSSGAVTGYYVLTSKLVDGLISDQWITLAVAGVLVWCCVIVFTRSFPLATAALIANMLPTAFVLSFPGIIGERINMGATLIAAVSIGLSIDGSVHFLAAFDRLRRRGYTVRQSAIHAAGNIGVPLVWATVALVVGFAALSTSEFIPIATFGTLVSATLAVGTLVNLTLLPVMVVSWTKDV